MNGEYRQTHESVSLWLAEAGLFVDAYLTIGRVDFSPITNGIEWAFVLVENQTDLWAFCPFGSSPTNEERLEPESCYNWWVAEYDFIRWSWYWYQDPYFDVDKCDENGNEPQPNTSYDKIICFMDPDLENGIYSHYQGLFGIYTLDNMTLFDDRPTYKQQRLLTNSDGGWYIIWYDERDSWVINDYIPSSSFGGAVVYYESICDQDINKPNNCSQTWDFQQGYQDLINKSNAKMFAINSLDESQCMKQPVDDIIEYTKSITLCFDDGDTVFYENSLTGIYLLSNEMYNNRRYWYKNDSYGIYYLFYDTPKRFWVIDDTLGDPSYFTSPDFEIYCLRWDEFEPFNCKQWYFYSLIDGISYNQTMTTNCTLPTSAPTNDPTIYPTAQPLIITTITTTTMIPIGGPDAANTDNGNNDSLMIWLIVGGLLLCCCIVIIFGYYIKKGDKDKIAKPSGGLASQHNLHADDAMVQLGPINTTGFGGETIKNDDEFEDSDIVDNGELANDPLDGDNLDTGGTKGGGGGPDNDDDDENVVPASEPKESENAPLNWEKFDSFDGLINNTGDNDQNMKISPEINPFDDDDNNRRMTVGTIGKDDGDNPFLASDVDDEDIMLPNTMEQRQNWVAFQE